jgi:hypothetical protein
VHSPVRRYLSNFVTSQRVFEGGRLSPFMAFPTFYCFNRSSVAVRKLQLAFRDVAIAGRPNASPSNAGTSRRLRGCYKSTDNSVPLRQVKKQRAKTEAVIMLYALLALAVAGEQHVCSAVPHEGPATKASRSGGGRAAMPAGPQDRPVLAVSSAALPFHFCAGHTVSAGAGPGCAAVAEACSAVLPPPSPPPGE